VTRALGILAAVAAFAAAAVPVASASPSAKPPHLGVSAKGSGAGKVVKHTQGTALMVNAAGGWDPLRRAR
jgi:hypothetical protein